jgi:ketosteroid isomerase-like protein
MKKCLLIGCLACVVCFSANTRAQEQQSKAEAEEQTYFALHNTLQQLDAFLAKKAEAIMTSNAAAIANLYTDDAVFITTAGPVYGKEGVQRQYEAWFNQRHFLNHKIIRDSTTTHILGLDNGVLTIACSGTWAHDVQEGDKQPYQTYGYWSGIYVEDGDLWKCKWLTAVLVPPPAPAKVAASK